MNQDTIINGYPLHFRVGDTVWYMLDRVYYESGDEGQYQNRQCVEVKCTVVNITEKRVLLRKVGDPETVKPFAVLHDKV